MNIYTSSLTVAIVTLGVVVSAVACALIAVRPAKAFAALADLSPHDRKRISPKYPFNMFLYGWFLLTVLPWIASNTAKSLYRLWDILAFIAVISIILAPPVYIFLWTRALYSQDIGSDLRKGLPFLIAGAALIEIFLVYSFASSIRGT